MKKLYSQAGDTLIEVMIALAIISSVISMSYATASRALRVGQQAQDRTEALKLVESQIEILKAAAGTIPVPAVSVFNIAEATTASAESFCFKGNTNIVKNFMVPNADLLADSFKTNTISGIFAPGDVYDISCTQGVANRYKLSITRTDITAGVPATIYSTFVFKARWDRLGGGRDEVVMYYKLHKGMF